MNHSYSCRSDEPLEYLLQHEYKQLYQRLVTQLSGRGGGQAEPKALLLLGAMGSGKTALLAHALGPMVDAQRYIAIIYSFYYTVYTLCL